MKIHFDASSSSVTITNHVFQLEVGHGDFTEEVEVELEERRNEGECRAHYLLVDNGNVDQELLDAIQMSSDELRERLVEELKRQSTIQT